MDTSGESDKPAIRSIHRTLRRGHLLPEPLSRSSTLKETELKGICHMNQLRPSRILLLATMIVVAVLSLGLSSVTAGASPVRASASASSPDVAPAASANAAASTPICASGYVCIFKGDVFDGKPASDHPKLYSWYYYGTYNVYNLTGGGTIFNCQTGGAKATGYSAYNGGGSKLWTLGNNCSGGYTTGLTALYSVKLYA